MNLRENIVTHCTGWSKNGPPG